MSPRKANSGRSKRRQPRKGFPHRVVAYLDREAKRALDDALEMTGENMSMFAARAITDLAKRTIKRRAK